MKLLSALLACASLCLAAPKVQPKTEIGEINGAKFRIDIPDNWNGGLVMYCHGYSPVAGACSATRTLSTFPSCTVSITENLLSAAPSWGAR